MSKHTPGPWTIDGFNMAAVIHCTKERGHPDAKHSTGDYEQIARCEGENWKANARLIAAAPELLSELVKLRRAYVNLLEAGKDRITSLGGECDPVDMMERSDPALTSARAAIAKATGGAA